MTSQGELADVTSRLEEATEELMTPSDELAGVSRRLVEAVGAAGLQATTGTIAFAGQYATGSYNVQYNNQNGGFSSTWPQWAFELAKEALVSGKRVWVASNGDPFGSNLVFVLHLA
jgi:hypothetical protein